MQEADLIAKPDPKGVKDPAAESPFEQTYRGLMRAIYEGSLIPGQRLIAPDLMRRFGVGRGTIREALHRLASSGVVSIIPNRGAQVRQLTRREVDEVLDIVEVLFGLAARGAAGSIHEADNRDQLRKLHAALHPAYTLDAFNQFLEAREAYYRGIVALSGNHELQRQFPSAQVHIMRVQLRNFGRAADSVDPNDYLFLTNAILSGDVEKAETAGRHHVEFTKRRVETLPDRAFLTDR